jgi:hypothetical protein
MSADTNTLFVANTIGTAELFLIRTVIVVVASGHIGDDGAITVTAPISNCENEYPTKSKAKNSENNFFISIHIVLFVL